MLPTQRDLRETVISFPPSTTMGGILAAQTQRGPYLPYRGSKERDRVLRLYDHDENNTLWQGAASGMTKKWASVEYTIDGDDGELVQYYHDLLGNAHLGRGWPTFVKLLGRDFLTQTYGGVIEIAGYGNEWDPLPPDLPIVGINHLDSGRCYFTGNPIYPVIYYSLWDGRLHKMHADRVYIMVDDPDPDERYLGIGTCALERAIAVAQREIRMAQYIETKLDDKPNPGILTLQGIADEQWKAALARYILEQGADARPIFGRTLVLGNTVNEVRAESIPFSQPPDKFDFTQYVSLDVDMLALALGCDRQEIWQLQGGNIGSGQQSEILAEKSRGKTFGDFLTALERFLNWAVLPTQLKASLKDNDERKQKAQAEIDQMYSSVAQQLSALPGVSTKMILQLLVDKSETFKNAFTDESGKIILPIVDRYTMQQAVSVDSVTPVPPNQAALAQTPEGQTVEAMAPQGAQVEQTSLDSDTPATEEKVKSFNTTSAAFKMRFVDIAAQSIDRLLTPAEFETLLLATLERSGQDAFMDGLSQGGINELSDLDRSELMRWTIDQIDFIDSLKSDIFEGGLTLAQVPMRADMWANKSLTDAYNMGVSSADRDGMYEWVYGATEHCADCARLNGQVHRYSQWYSKGWLPQSDRLDCHGYLCQCRLVKTQRSASGRF